MAFSSDETYLNNINLGVITDFNKYLQQIRPILIEEAGFKEVTDDNFVDPKITSEIQSTLQQIERVRAGDPSAMEALAQSQHRKSWADLSGTQQEELRASTLKVSEDALRELDRLRGEQRTKLVKTDERKALDERFKKLQDMELSQREAALSGNIELPKAVADEIQQKFAAFKESEARAGRVVIGDSPTNAVSKGGTAGQEALSAFRREIDALKLNYENSILGRGMPFTGLSPAFTGAIPQSPQYATQSGLALSGQQPFQFDRQMQYNYDVLSRSSKSASGKSGLLGQVAGMGLGAVIGNMMVPGMGAFYGAQLGGGLGQGAGTLLGG